MDLTEIRQQIDGIDDKILDLFVERMKLTEGVAKYKVEHSLPVFQGAREKEILKRVAAMSPENMAEGTKLLFANLMDISKCYQQEQITPVLPFVTEEPPENPRVACQGTVGSYSEAACRRLFGKSGDEISFFQSFDEVFDAVENGRVDYGVLPIENSTAGGVALTYDLMGRHSFYVYKRVTVKINNVFAVRKGTKRRDITSVFSHEHALKQCTDFLAKNPHIMQIPYKNTALAAKMVSESEQPFAAICSRDCAQLYGLEILEDDITNIKENYTRFICISKNLQVNHKANIVSLSLSLPHTSGALYRLLTRFAFSGLNLCKIESKPVPSNEEKEDTFDVIFYLDFIGTINNPSVVKLLHNLQAEMKYYKFLGNYEDII